ncbi:MAG: AAA family ATPase [Planctomycetes bacterium]|nr:AAA family ATPase [Planctomycetota bacterium]
MKLRTVGIVGFGKFRGAEKPITIDFGPGFNLVVGPNEAGKSTLQACLVRTLFGTPRFEGFPDYEPWDGGDYQTWVEVEASDGLVYRVARSFRAKAKTPVEVFRREKEGRETLLSRDVSAVHALLERELGTTDERVFYATACISQIEIDPRDRRFSGNLRHAAERAIGGGAGDSTYSNALRRLGEKLAALQRAGELDSGPIVRLERELARLREQEAAASHRESRLRELSHLCRRQAERRAHLRREVSALSAQLSNYRTRTEARERLHAAESAITWTEGRMGALARLKEEIVAADRRMSLYPDFFRKEAGLIEKVVQLETELKGLTGVETSARGELAGLPRAIADLTTKEAELSARVTALEGESATLSTLATAQAEQVALEPRIGILETREKEIEERIQRVEDVRKKIVLLSAALEKTPKGVRTTPALEAKALAIQERLVARKKVQKETQTRYEETRKGFANSLPSYFLFSLLLTLAALSLATGAFFLAKFPELGIVAGVFGLTSLGLAGLGTKVFRNNEAQAAERNKDLAIAAQNAELATKEAAAVESERKFVLQASGLPSIETLLQTAGQARQLQSEIAAAQSALTVLLPTGGDAALRAERDTVRSERSNVKVRIDALRGVSGSVSLTLPEVKARLARIAEDLPPAQRELRELRERLNREEGRKRAVQSTAESAGPRRADLERRRAELLTLASSAQIGSLDEVVQAYRAFQEVAAERKQKCATFDALVKEGTLEVLADKLRGLELDRSAHQEKIASVPGETLPPERVAESEKRLAHLEGERDRVEREFAQYEDERKLLERQDLDLMEIEEGIAYAEGRLARLRVQVQALERAAKVLEGAAKKVREDLASPLQRAIASVFIEMTQNSYTGVQVDVDPSEFTFRPLKGDRAVDAESLSRGTRDQLYFAIRYGLARVMVGQEREPFLILDDPFAHFDGERLRNVLLALRRISARAQVLLFTKDIPLAQEVAGWGRVITLERA